MNAPISPVILLDAVRRMRDQRLAERSLIEFTKQSWEIIEPGVKFQDNWHLHDIADHLEAITNGELENLIINIPPGCMKSILVSVAWPAWEWMQDPALRYLGASYGGDLAIRDASKCRDIIVSDWYQERWPRVQVKKGSDQKTKYELTAGGWRMATSVGGRATGEHPDRKLIDDPHNAKQAESEVERESALVWFDRTLSTRGESRGAKTIVVMQRLHERDLTGHILANKLEGYTHLCIPMEYDGVPRTTSLGWKDPRAKVGSLLWPELFNEKSVARLKRNLGEYGASGQLQQKPSPPGGGILKIKHFQKWPAQDTLPAFSMVVQSYDTAYTEDTQNDPTAGTVWGIFTNKGKKCALLLDAWSEHMEYPALRTKVLDEWHSVYGKTEGRKGRKADFVLVEKKSSGQSLIQDLRLGNVPVRGYVPTSMDKIARAHQAAPLLEIDCFYVMESKKEPGTYVMWARPFLDQCEKFPNAEHDDYVDTFTQFCIFSRDAGFLELDYAEEDVPEELDYIKKRKVNPYGG
jgi:predicted phage terminase large subunit-like protein